MTREPRTAEQAPGADSVYDIPGGIYCNRLAAVADSEGCFVIAKAQRKSRGRGIFNRPVSPMFRCEFVIQVRADDLEFLSRLKDGCHGIGRLTVVASKQTPGWKNNPKARWVVSRQREVLKLVHIFDAYPLWSKKRLDYLVWREAVIRWVGDRAVTTEEWERSYKALRACRVYDPTRAEAA